MTALIKKIYDYLVPVLIVGIIGTTVALCGYRNAYIKADKEIGNATNTILALNTDMELKDGYIRVLELNTSHLSDFNNELIHKLDSVAEELRINKKRLQYAIGLQLSLMDTATVSPVFTDTTTVVSSCDFEPIQTIFNPMTIVTSSMLNGELTTELYVAERLYLYIEDDKIWRNPRRKNFFDRLFHWDFKKDVIYKAKVEHDNEQIKINDIKVIKGI
ncbi:hypothetical protein AGMMS50239_26000 [Bacteroidia bacterium]|nr:hypothetical protein AGMMS50239_26000 [Bacteroidia bacterium]